MIILLSFLILIAIPFISPSNWQLMLLSVLCPIGLMINSTKDKLVNSTEGKNDDVLRFVNALLVFIVLGLSVLVFSVGDLKSDIDVSLGLGNKIDVIYELYYFFIFILCIFIKKKTEHHK